MRTLIPLSLLSTLTFVVASGAAHAQAYLYISSNSGTINRYQGPGGATPGQFDKKLNAPGDPVQPTSNIGLAIGPDGNLYVPTSTNVIRYSGVTGNYLDTFMTGNLRGGAFDAAGNYYVGEQNTGIIFKNTGGIVSVFANNATNSGDVRNMKFGPDGKLYVAYASGGNVRRFDATGAVDGTYATNFPNGVTFDSVGNLLVTNYFTHAISAYSAPGVLAYSFSTAAHTPDILDVAFDDSGALYADHQDGGVYRYGLDGTYLGVFGQTANLGLATTNSYSFLFSSSGAGTSAETPEPGTVALLGALMTVGAGFLRKRRK
jgi:WD40 repeat protein